jgi:hypothetical protein
MRSLKFQGVHQKHSNKTLARLLAEYEAENPFPQSVDLLCRTGTKHNSYELKLLVESIELYWPKCAGRVVLGLDLNQDEDFVRQHLPSWIDVVYSEFSEGLGPLRGNQAYNMYSEQQSQADYVAIIDSDVVFNTPITPDLIFNLEKKDSHGNYPVYVQTDTEFQKGKYNKGDTFFQRGDSNYWNFMVALPIVFPRSMFPKFRDHVEQMHPGFETTDLWREVDAGRKGPRISQFGVLGNYLVRHWDENQIDVRTETDVPAMRYGVHIPYHLETRLDKYTPEQFEESGRRIMADGLCELFCSDTTAPGASVASLPQLENCASLCPAPIPSPRLTYFIYENPIYGTTEMQREVLEQHFRPLRQVLASRFQ